MPSELLDQASRPHAGGCGDSGRVKGVTICEVVNNVDATRQGRVQIRLPWAGGITPWARIATPGAGLASGLYMQPQIGDEVLVAFNHEDIRQPVIIGSLWNSVAQPPALLPSDAATKTILRTRYGNQISCDDLSQSISISTLAQQEVTLTPAYVELKAAGGAASVRLTSDGSVTITAANGVSINAPSITLNGANVTINGSATTTVMGGTLCSIGAALVKIN